MNALLENVLRSKTFTTKDGRSVTVRSETGLEQCLFLQKIINDHHYTRSIEIGFAYGTSTLAITEAVVNNGGSHTVIDVYEHTAWEGMGLDLLKQAGYGDKFEFHEEYCYTVLPKLLASGRKFDFAYIDSTKQFDWLMVDFFFIDKMLEKGGMIVFDDVSFPGIRKLLRYLVQFPDYRVHDAYPKNQSSALRSTIKSVSTVLPFRKKFLKQELTLTDPELGINSNCVALQKMGDDSRTWDWHKDF